MTDSDKIYAAIDGLRAELRTEFMERRAEVDRDFKELHQRIDKINNDMQPLLQLAGNQRFLARVGAWTLGTLIALGVLVLAALKHASGQ